MSHHYPFKVGDRVRVVYPNSPQTGKTGSIRWMGETCYEIQYDVNHFPNTWTLASSVEVIEVAESPLEIEECS